MGSMEGEDTGGRQGWHAYPGKAPFMAEVPAAPKPAAPRRLALGEGHGLPKAGQAAA